VLIVSLSSTEMRRGARRRRVAVLLASVLAITLDAEAAGFGLRFFGNGGNGVGLVSIPLIRSGAGGAALPINAGASDFVLEFWMKAARDENAAPAADCGANASWTRGNVVIDRDRPGGGRSFGVAIADGRVVFGVTGANLEQRTICGTTDVLDYRWHHVAVQRGRSDGQMWLYVDGVLEAAADGPDGDLSYPGNGCDEACQATDAVLVVGRGRREVGRATAFSGWLDEMRISTALRYPGEFTRPSTSFVPDDVTAGLYHLDEGTADVIGDSSGAASGPSHGRRHHGGSPRGPAWSTDVPALTGDLPVGVEFVTDVPDQPVAIADPGDGSGRLFIVLRHGRIVVHDGIGLIAEPFLDVSSLVGCCGGERGLLSIAFHPEYASNGFFYVNYSNTALELIVARYRVSADNPNRADPASATTVLVIPQPATDPPPSLHFGGQLQFGPDGYLYISRGDGGRFQDPDNNGQRLDTLLGKVLRIDVDGAEPYAIPADNPHAGEPGARPEIWATGLRNPWRISFDRSNGDLFIADVGQERREEVNHRPSGSGGGENYGWRLMEGSLCFVPASGCDPGDLTPPIIEYDHDLGCSVVGGYRYRGHRIPELHGRYLFGDFCEGIIWGAAQEAAGPWDAASLVETGFRLTSFGEDVDGEIYVADLAGRAIHRLVHGMRQAVPAINTLTPARVVARGRDVALRVGGTAFGPSSVVRWSGRDRPTTFVAGTELIAEIPEGDLVAGAASIRVFTPEPGGGLSNEQSLTVTAPFGDVPAHHWAAAFIDALVAAGFTAGCGGQQFCPDTAVNRAQTAVFLVRGILGPGADPPPATGMVFQDVPQGAFAAAWIEHLATLGITAGCGPGRFCPERSLTRQEMAVLLLLARHGVGYEPPAASGAMFSDVSGTHPYAAWIEQLAREGITAGCGAGRYCPEGPVRRAEMAVFLVRGFGIPL
jgi:glucose/arabinose dehydrogenase